MTDDQFALLIGELRAMHAELIGELRAIALERQAGGVSDRHAELIAAIADYFGPGTFTASGVLDAVDECPTGPLAFAVAAVIDLDGASPAIALGRLFGRLPALEPVGDRRGAGLYRVRAEVDD